MRSLTKRATLLVQLPERPISPVARSYSEQSLDLMQANALHRLDIDWKNVRAQPFSKAQEAQTAMDTYPAIFYPLNQLE